MRSPSLCPIVPKQAGYAAKIPDILRHNGGSEFQCRSRDLQVHGTDVQLLLHESIESINDVYRQWLNNEFRQSCRCRSEGTRSRDNLSLRSRFAKLGNPATD